MRSGEAAALREEGWGFSCGGKQLLPEMRERGGRQHRKAHRSLQRTQSSIEGQRGIWALWFRKGDAQHSLLSESHDFSRLYPSYLFKHSVSQHTADTEGSVAEWVLVSATVSLFPSPSHDCVKTEGPQDAISGQV